MRYYSDETTLYIRGAFRAASTGIGGGIRSVPTLLNHTVPKGWNRSDPEKEIELVAARAGIGHDVFGLLTAVPIQDLCVLQYDFITVFVTAGIRTDQPADPGTINIIVYSGEGMEDAALLETVLVATEAKTEALLATERPFSGTPTDAIIAACEGAVKHRYAGRLTEPGRRVRAAVMKGVPEALARYEGGARQDAPAFFVFSRFGGEHWVEWTPVNCPYYPCHFPGQRCDFCYCPFYPCGDESLGEWTESLNHGRVWNCARCTLLHEPLVADYLKRFPGATLKELKQVYEKNRKDAKLP